MDDIVNAPFEKIDMSTIQKALKKSKAKKKDNQESKENKKNLTKNNEKDDAGLIDEIVNKSIDEVLKDNDKTKKGKKNQAQELKGKKNQEKVNTKKPSQVAIVNKKLLFARNDDQQDNLKEINTSQNSRKFVGDGTFEGLVERFTGQKPEDTRK